MRPILFLIQKEFRQVVRDSIMMRIIFVLPIIQLLVLAYAANSDLRQARVAILDSDHTTESRALIDAVFNASESIFVPAFYAQHPHDLEKALVKREADLALRIPRGFSKSLFTGETASLGVYVDGTNSSLSGKASGYMNSLIRQHILKVRGSTINMQDSSVVPPLQIQGITRFFYNPHLESRLYMVPGIIVVLVTLISGMLTGMAVVKEKEIGTLEQLMVTPITSIQFIIGKTIPFAILAYLEMTIATTFGVLWFAIPLRGSVFVLASSAAVYLLVTLGGGLLVSTIARTQQQAMFIIWFFLVVGIMLCGFFFPVENMPDSVQYLTYLNPMRYIMTIFRAVFLKGSTFTDIVPDLMPLMGIGAVVFSLAILRFQKRVG